MGCNKSGGKKKIAHSWAYKGYPGGTEVIFEIFAEGESTKLNVT